MKLFGVDIHTQMRIWWAQSGSVVQGRCLSHPWQTPGRNPALSLQCAPDRIRVSQQQGGVKSAEAVWKGHYLRCCGWQSSPRIRGAISSPRQPKHRDHPPPRSGCQPCAGGRVGVQRLLAKGTLLQLKTSVLLCIPCARWETRGRSIPQVCAA